MAQEVIKNIKEIKKQKGEKNGAFVEIHNNYEGDQVFFTEDGLSTITVTKDGDVATLLSVAGGGRAVPLLLLAIDNGGIKGDFYGSDFLQETYESVGFQMVTQTPFDDNYAPEEWDYDEFGRPPVVTMLHNGDSIETIQKSKYTNVRVLALPEFDYDDAKAYRDELINRLNEAKGEKHEKREDETNEGTTKENNGSNQESNGDSDGRDDERTIQEIIQRNGRRVKGRSGSNRTLRILSNNPNKINNPDNNSENLAIYEIIGSQEKDKFDVAAYLINNIYSKMDRIKRRSVDNKKPDDLREHNCRTFITQDGKTTTLLEFLH